MKLEMVGGKTVFSTLPFDVQQYMKSRSRKKEEEKEKYAF